MNIQQNLIAIGGKIETMFGQTGGVEPITWSVLPNGAGGSITSGGLYTAPSLSSIDPNRSIDTIQAEDVNGEIAIATIMVLPPLGLVANIIQVEMGLSQNQVMLYNQKFNIPKDDRIYISVGILSDKAYGNSKTFDRSGTGIKEIINTNWRGICSIEISSSSNQALLRRNEIVMALTSNYSEQQQEANNFKLARIASNFVNLSREEGPGIPYRFNISVPMLYVTSTEKEIPYFDNYDTNIINIDS